MRTPAGRFRGPGVSRREDEVPAVGVVLVLVGRLVARQTRLPRDPLLAEHRLQVLHEPALADVTADAVPLAPVVPRLLPVVQLRHRLAEPPVENLLAFRADLRHAG